MIAKEGLPALRRWLLTGLPASIRWMVRTSRPEDSASAITTRRALARGLGYENPETFDDPKAVMEIQMLWNRLSEMSQEMQKKELEKQFPEHIRLPCSRIASGETLGQLADISDGLSLSTDEKISQEAKKLAASLFD
jgi:hypothetical protein